MRRTRILTAVLALAAGLPAGTRQQSTQTWTPLLDSAGWDDWGTRAWSAWPRTPWTRTGWAPR
ncbi:hypothetical protein [Streptomyces sp. NPDC002250]|uniref:hypothetical protein n=1 Tax=Streptomyces sp. NPDC002250 TaxID=3364641 RepID=UPI0036B53B5D